MQTTLTTRVAAGALALTVAAGAAAEPAPAAGLERVSVGPGGVQAAGPSFGPAFSADARHLAFYSQAANPVPGDTNRHSDVFVRDRR